MKKALLVLTLVIITGVSAFAGNFYLQNSTTLSPQTSSYSVSNAFTFGYVAPELYWSFGVTNTYGVAAFSFPIKGGFNANIYETSTSSLAANLSATFTPTLAFNTTTTPTSFTYDYAYGVSIGLTYLHSGLKAGVSYTYPGSTITLKFRYDFPQTSWSKPATPKAPKGG